jgi:2-amino-4-hydroxy-6-hydroxymethyldihydropteridine diphosphokinase
MYRVYLGLGSNLGDRAKFLRRALLELQEIVEIQKCSSVYETQPSGMASANAFYNMAVKVITPFSPPRLLHAVKSIERKLGRSPATHLKDREIDIDILLYENLYYEEHELQVPHPGLPERKFVLVPLKEIGAEATDPFTGTSMASLLRKCPDKSQVRKADITIAIQP